MCQDEAGQKGNPELHIEADAANHPGMLQFFGSHKNNCLSWAQRTTRVILTSVADVLLLVLHRRCTRRQIMAGALCGSVHRRAYIMGL